MANPVISKGFNSKAVIVAETSYGTTPATGQIALPLISETLTRNKSPNEEEVKNAFGAARVAPTYGNEVVEGSTVFNLDYLKLKTLIGIATGATVSGSPPIYVFDPAEEIGLGTTKYGSIVIDQQVKFPTYKGGLIEQIVIKSVAGANPECTIEVQWVFKTRTLETSIPSATLTITRIKHSHLVFRIGDISDALSATDALILKDFTLTMKNNLNKVYGSGSNYIVEPRVDTPRETTLDISAVYYDDSDEIAAIMTASENKTQLQADLTFTNTGGGGEYFTIALPELFLNSEPSHNISSSGLTPFTASFNAYKNIHNTTNMSTATKEVLFTVRETTP